MAIIHYDVTFEKDPPNLEIIKKRLEERTGLRVDLARDSIEVRHDWPHIGAVRASGTLECDEVDGADLEMTVGSTGVRITWVAPSTHPYFRDSALGVLIDLGGNWQAPLPPSAQRKWKDLTEAERAHHQ